MTRTDLRIQFSKHSGYQYMSVLDEILASQTGVRTEYIDFLEQMVLDLDKELNDLKNDTSKTSS